MRAETRVLLHRTGVRILLSPPFFGPETKSEEVLQRRMRTTFPQNVLVSARASLPAPGEDNHAEGATMDIKQRDGLSRRGALRAGTCAILALGLTPIETIAADTRSSGGRYPRAARCFLR